ncbi:alpha/beta fold hydrolase [Paenibacillus sp. GSMTC-2017]|uniref:alpha/beta hydrolase n=1 Tax=Paenibacillus sp. GSMTC-2017 TaxID=2794350 RepID=UPI0018D683CF|nr:alpha/beta fold hydrolase [Paenibacillus sp. GSMTC-2017]
MLTEWWFYVGVIVALFIVFGALIWWIGAKSQQPRIVPNDKDPQIDTGWKSLTFQSSGFKIEGWLLQPAVVSGEVNGLTPIVVIAHGWGSNRTRVLRYAKPLYEAGYAVLMYDARSHGESDKIKGPSALMFRDDVIAAVAEARKLPGIDPHRVAILGHSMGGFGTLLALDEGLRVNAVVTDSMPVHFDTMLKAELDSKKLPMFPLAYLIPKIWMIRSKISKEQFESANIPVVLKKNAGAVEEGKQPVLMLHSYGDTFIPADDLSKLVRELPQGTIDTVFVNTEGHSSSEQDPGFWKTILPFLEQAFARRV